MEITIKRVTLYKQGIEKAAKDYDNCLIEGGGK
jgi:hypothetical protein